MKKRIAASLLLFVMMVSTVGCNVKINVNDNRDKKNADADSEAVSDNELSGKEDVTVSAADIEETVSSDAIKGNDRQDDDSEWQEAFREKLNELAAGNIEDDLPFYGGGYEVGSEEYEEMMSDLPAYEYFINDIDKDDVPEMIVEFGTCEADYDGIVYKYDKITGTAGWIGEISMSHTSFLTDPDGEGMLQQVGHMGWQSIMRHCIKDGKITTEDLFEETLDFEDPDAEYTRVDEIVPGAVYMCGTPVNDDFAITAYRSYTEDIQASEIPSSYKVGDENELAIRDLIENNGELVAVKNDEFADYEAGEYKIDDFIKVSGFDVYEGDNPRIGMYAFADFDKDGESECILVVLRDTDNGPAGSYILLDRFEGTVYAYYLSYMYGTYTPMLNGSFRPTDIYYEQYGYKRVLTEGEHFCIYFVPSGDKTEDVKWIEIGQTEGDS